MIDHELRPLKDRLVGPVAVRVPVAIPVGAVTATGLAAGVGAAVAAAGGLAVVAVVLWLLNRFLDGLDGAIARARGRSSDLGGYLDMLADVVVYAAVPLGVAVSVDTRAGWMAVAVLLGSFYVNAVSWAYLAALVEKRRAGAADTATTTSVTMPRGVVEGAETMVAYVVLLALPHRLVEISAVMTVLVVAGVAQRVVAARRWLSSPDVAHQADD